MNLSAYHVKGLQQMNNAPDSIFSRLHHNCKGARDYWTAGLLDHDTRCRPPTFRVNVCPRRLDSMFSAYKFRKFEVSCGDIFAHPYLNHVRHASSRPITDQRRHCVSVATSQDAALETQQTNRHWSPASPTELRFSERARFHSTAKVRTVDATR